MNNNILVIGNGFDLAHGMKTKYENFIEYIRLKEYEKDCFLDKKEKDEIRKIACDNGFIKYLINLTTEIPGWVDFEREILKITDVYSDFFETYRDIIYHTNYNERIYPSKASNLLKEILVDFGIVQKSENIYIVDTMFYSKIYGLNKKAVITRLRNHLDMLIRGLEIYLQSCEKAFFCNSEGKEIEYIKEINPSYVISFNYTETYKIYNINEEDVFHIHGKLGEKNIVLGFDDKNAEQLDFVYFKKYFQRIQKLTGYIDDRRLGVNDCGIMTGSNIYFYGHSIDKTDADVIMKLRSYAKSIIIYIYNQEDYEQKVINLIDIFGKANATNMIQSKFIKFLSC